MSGVYVHLFGAFLGAVAFYFDTNITRNGFEIVFFLGNIALAVWTYAKHTETRSWTIIAMPYLIGLFILFSVIMWIGFDPLLIIFPFLVLALGLKRMKEIHIIAPGWATAGTIICLVFLCLLLYNDWRSGF